MLISACTHNTKAVSINASDPSDDLPCAQADVINRGFGGYYTPWIVKYLLDELFDVANPTMVLLFLGTKDTLTQGVTG